MFFQLPCSRLGTNISKVNCLSASQVQSWTCSCVSTDRMSLVVKLMNTVTFYTVADFMKKEQVKYLWASEVSISGPVKCL